MIDRWSDCIGQDRDSRHLGTLSTILQHFTHNETQWPTAACWCHFALRNISTPTNPTIAAMASMLGQIGVRTVYSDCCSYIWDLQLWTKNIEWSHPSTMSSYSASPGSPRLTILEASPVRILIHCVVKHISSPPDLNSSSNVSLPIAWITGPKTKPSLYFIF